MSAAAAQQAPAVPPRPSRAADKESSAGVMPKMPPRPAYKHERSISPNPDRFAPSPLNGAISSKAFVHGQLHGQKERPSDPIERAGSVSLPSVGEEGAEYGVVSNELRHDEQQSSSPERTRTVADDLKLHAPKPSLPAASAKKQVMAVTRTDSDRAASSGIGRPTSIADERTASRNSNKKRPESSFSAHSDHHTDDEHGIPEIGQRVPMNPHLGDVQAPSPSPSSGPECAKKHHGRKHSSQGLPPGSYGLHGHGVAPQDKLEKAYYQKHPDVMEREQHTPLHDRQNDFAMSSTDLNKLVRDTANRQSALGMSDFRGTLTKEVAFMASEEYTSRICSSRPASAAPNPMAASQADIAIVDQGTPIHVDDARHPEFYSCGDKDNSTIKEEDEEEEYKAPILASDEVNKDPIPQTQHPAVHHHIDRRGNHQEMEESSSRPTSRPSSIHAVSHQPAEFESTRLEDVEEYEPLFSEETKEDVSKHESADENEGRHHFPSKDVWEDAPSSVHYTALVSTPEVPDQTKRRSSAYHEDRPITPAQAFAQYQEQLAESDTTCRPDGFMALSEEKPTWIDHQPHLSPRKAGKPSPSQRFPSRDVWEDAPESQLHEAVLSGPPVDPSDQEAENGSTRQTTKTVDAPVIPNRPKPRQSSGDSVTKPRPPISEKPKPQMTPQIMQSSSSESSSKEAALSKSKPAVPNRPVGNKIAALQAGFMSDLNKRLQLGQQAPKKEEDAKEEESVETQEKVPLSDARKGRARGPQHRAPARRSTTAAATSMPPQAAGAAVVPILTLSSPYMVWNIDPDDGELGLGTESEASSDAGADADDFLRPVILTEPHGSSHATTTITTDLAQEPRMIDEAPVAAEAEALKQHALENAE